MPQPFDILVLDDDRDAADLLSTLLDMRVEGAAVRVVYAGEDAVAAGLERRPDAGIFDLEMSGLDGEGAARVLREAYPDPRLRLIAVSGNVLRLASLRQTGTFDYLMSKPVDLLRLIELLRAESRAARQCLRCSPSLAHGRATAQGQLQTSLASLSNVSAALAIFGAAAFPLPYHPRAIS